MTELLTDLVPGTVVTANSHPALFNQAMTLSDMLNNSNLPEPALQLADVAFFFRESGTWLTPELHAASPDHIRAIRRSLGRKVLTDVVDTAVRLMRSGAVASEVTDHALIVITGQVPRQNHQTFKPQHQQRSLSFSY